jgi:glutathione peroxidase-family protein
VSLVFEREILEEDGMLIIEHSKDTKLEHMMHFSFAKTYGGTTFSFSKLNLKKKKILKKKTKKIYNFLKKSRPISRILFPINWNLIIYLVPILLSGSSCLPFNIGRVTLIPIT